MPDKNRSAAGHPAPKAVRDEGPAEVAGGNIDGAKRRGFILYPGKLTEVETFRVGCIGAIGRHEMSQAVNAAAETLREMGIPDGRPAA